MFVGNVEVDAAQPLSVASLHAALDSICKVAHREQGDAVVSDLRDVAGWVCKLHRVVGVDGMCMSKDMIAARKGDRFVALLKQLMVVSYFRSGKNLTETLEGSSKSALPAGLVEGFFGPA